MTATNMCSNFGGFRYRLPDYAAHSSDRNCAAISRSRNPQCPINGATLQWILYPSTTPVRDDQFKPSQEQVNIPILGICSA